MSKLEQILREYGAPIPAAPAPEPEVIEGDFGAQDAAPTDAPADIFDGGADAARLPIPQGGE